MQLVPDAALARLRARWALIAQHQLILSDLQAGMEGELRSLGIDPDTVVLDLDRGIVVPKESPDGPAVEPAQ